MRMRRVLVAVGLLTWIAPFGPPALAGEPPLPERVEFNRDIRPILSGACFQCHGPDERARQAGLRLDQEERARQPLESGETAIVPGDTSASELVRRITADDPDERMPPADAPRKLAPRQIELLRRWVEQGAEYQPHWAFIAPAEPELPAVQGGGFRIENPIDLFVAARLQQDGLAMSPEADRATLVRRVTLDLTGLPPSPREVDEFLADHAPDAYEKLVDRLFASPHYGERMALPWLDAARYADSNGFQQDGDTYQYVWRDWVVRALNANMPSDQFTIEQLAGDLLPAASDEQKIATGFNRCHLLNGEGGAIAEEQRNVILHDRVDVTSTNWLGLTMTCSQCHDHKYDPITQRDYYQLFAFFNNVPETGTPPGGGQYRIADPWIYAASGDDIAPQRALEARIAAAAQDAKRIEKLPEIAAEQSAWEAAVARGPMAAPRLEGWMSVGPFTAESFDKAFETAYDPEMGIDVIDVQQNYQNGELKWTPQPEWEDGKLHALEGENTAVYLHRVIHADRDQLVTLSLGSDDAIKVWLNGALVFVNKVTRAVAADQDRAMVLLKAGPNSLVMKIVNGGGPGGFYFRALEKPVPAEIVAVVNTRPAARDEGAAGRLREYFLANHPPAALRDARVRQQSLEQELASFKATLPRVMVMSDAQPRKTRILSRGNYEMPADEVEADTPAALPPMPAGAPKNRLGLARWLVSAEHPLTARVQVNRYWQTFFGRGLTTTSENFGLQSEPPTHPELLDWLAVEFRKSGWDMKHVHRLIVTSATYRQSSRVTPELRERDPENRLLARGARFRLPSMTLRDVALASSGLLDARIGGRPVYPYQPKDIWDGLAITKERDFTYPQSTGADLFRRSLYTFWRRTVTPGNMFDASTRQTCKVRTSITSTPLHALTTLNDLTWVEAGRVLAGRVIKESSADADARLSNAFRRVCARVPEADELRVLRRSLDRALETFRADPQAARDYLALGESTRDAALDPAEHAAYATVCLAILNLDEALTRE